MNATAAYKLYSETRKLPLGHIDRTNAEKTLRNLYKECADINEKWCRKLKRQYRCLTEKQTLQFIKEFCDMIGEKRIPKVVFCSKELKYNSTAHYNHTTKEIHMGTSYSDTGTLTHELTHFIGAYGHGKIFIELQNFVLEVSDEIFKNWRKKEMCPWL